MADSPRCRSCRAGQDQRGALGDVLHDLADLPPLWAVG